MFSQFISIFHSRSHNFSQVVYCEFSQELSLNIGIYYIHLIAFTLSPLRTWNNVETDTTHNSQTDWNADRNSQTSQASIHNSKIIWVAIHRLPKPQTRKSQAHILELVKFMLCVHRGVNMVVWFMLISKA